MNCLIEVMTEHTCGDCAACCSTVPVAEIGLAAFTPCRHLCSAPLVGCSIYPGRPRGCREWNCQWLAEPEWPDALRPDRCGVVVDILPDMVRINGRAYPAMQFWVVPGHEDDYQHVAIVQDLIASVCHTGMAVIWRIRDLGKPLRQSARVMYHDGEKLVVSQITPGLAEDEHTLGPQRDRLRRAMQLTGGR